MVYKTEQNGRTVYLCEECGFGYSDKETAEKCEEYCSKFRSCSLEITSKAIWTPKQVVK